MRFSTFFAVSAFAGFAVAQSSTSSATSGAQTTVSDPNSVPAATRNTWCRAQQQTCPTLCGGDTANNTCDISTLTYNCTCSSPINLNVSDFTQTLPSLECQYAVAQCTAAHPDDAEGQATCQSVSCGSRNVTSQVDETPSSSASASATASSTGSSSGGASATASSSAAATTSADSSASLNFGKTYGSGALVAGLLALFGFAL